MEHPVVGTREGGLAMRICATGDALITRRVTRWGGGAYDSLLGTIRDADVRFTNLETSFTRGRGAPAAGWGGTYLTSPAACLGDLVEMGFNAFSRANNHAGDWGAEGVLETTRVCDEAGVCHAGAGADLAEARVPAYLDLAAGKVALLAVATAERGAGYAAGRRRPDCAGRPGVSCLRFEEYAVVPPEAFAQLRSLIAQSPHGRRWQYEIDLGFRGADPEGILSVGDVRFEEGDAFAQRWEANQADVAEIVRHIRDARRQADVVLLSFHGHEMSGGDPDAVPALHREFCRACIEAGCDAVIGHGPHRLRGIEIHRGKPIFYSLGNFIFQNEEATALPADFYERMGLDPIASTPADGFDRRNRRGRGGFAADRAFWETVVARWEMRDGALGEIRLYPVELGHGRPRPQRGRPALAQEPLGREIIDRMHGLCRPFGTEVLWDPRGYGVVRWER
jgi:poly-gamma-glutamate synthesis protein (capsule biosynthesis protein)